MQVKFDPRRGIPLTVVGIDEQACERVFAQVQHRIARNRSKDTRKASMMTVFHEIGDDQKAILTSAPYGRNRPYNLSHVRVGGKTSKVFHLTRLEKSNLDLEKMMTQMSLSKSSGSRDWSRFSESDLLEVVQKSLDLAEKASLKRNSLEFNISPGKLAFKSLALEDTGPSRLLELTPNRDGVITESQLKELGVLSFFNPLLHQSVTEGIAAGLTKDGFECLNPDKPDQLTIVHLLAGENRNHFTVALALDRDLHPLKENLDPRLDDEKRKAVEKVFRAKTIGEVLGGSGNPKILYKKISLLVHPDKNSHPGATEAFKKVQHAFEQTKSGNWVDYPALKISPVKKEGMTKAPPKVVSVKTQKKKMSNITFFSDQFLDLRASLTAFDEEGRWIS